MHRIVFCKLWIAIKLSKLNFFFQWFDGQQTDLNVNFFFSDLMANKIDDIHDEAFVDLKKLEDM